MDMSVSPAPRLRPALVPALLIAAIAAATIAAVWAFQQAGYTPCELCLQERLPFYVGLPVALVTALASAVERRGLAQLSCVLLGVLFIVSAGLAAYHTGVEWKLWPGPSGCTGAMRAAPSVGDFLKQLDTVKVVRCDAAALHVLGLSLAGWNVLVSLLLVGLAGWGLRRGGAGGARLSR